MPRTTQIARKVRTVIAGLILVAGAGTQLPAAGCSEDYIYAGDFLDPTVEPADFSPYGYDYDMYDLYTEDI